MYVLYIAVCPFVLFLLDIVLPVLLRFTDSDNPFGILKLVLYFVWNDIRCSIPSSGYENLQFFFGVFPSVIEKNRLFFTDRHCTSSTVSFNAFISSDGSGEGMGVLALRLTASSNLSMVFYILFISTEFFFPTFLFLFLFCQICCLSLRHQILIDHQFLRVSIKYVCNVCTLCDNWNNRFFFIDYTLFWSLCLWNLLWVTCDKVN